MPHYDDSAAAARQRVGSFEYALHPFVPGAVDEVFGCGAMTDEVRGNHGVAGLMNRSSDWHDAVRGAAKTMEAEHSK